VNQQTFGRMGEDERDLASYVGRFFPIAKPDVAAEGARRVARLWNQTLHLSTEAIDRGEFLHVAPVDAWSSLSLTAFSAWLAALERKQPHRDIEAGSLSRIATLLSAAQRALEQTPVVPLPTNDAAGG
jgi:hypothetical protein